MKLRVSVFYCKCTYDLIDWKVDHACENFSHNEGWLNCQWEPG